MSGSVAEGQPHCTRASAARQARDDALHENDALPPAPARRSPVCAALRGGAPDALLLPLIARCQELRAGKGGALEPEFGTSPAALAAELGRVAVLQEVRRDLGRVTKPQLPWPGGATAHAAPMRGCPAPSGGPD